MLNTRVFFLEAKVIQIDRWKRGLIIGRVPIRKIVHLEEGMDLCLVHEALPVYTE